MKNECERLATLLKQSKYAVFFGGAGVSTESGIPDFRSASGLYATEKLYGHSPEELLSHSCFVGSPINFFRYYKENLIYPNAQPNAAHTALAELERTGKLRAVITQNVDGLHQLAGSKNVLELHGSNHRQFCLSCGEKYTLDYILADENCEGFVPRCSCCGGVVRPDVVLYEEELDGGVLSAAVSALSYADLVIVGGTSLAVYPAAGLLRYAKGARLVLINKSPTEYDARAGLVICDSVGKILTEALELLRGF